MDIRSIVAGVFLCLTGTLAQADGVKAARRASPAESRRVVPAARPIQVVPGARLVPDCDDVRPRLMKCELRQLVSRNSLGRLQIIDGPPRDRRRPYPQLFTHPYGP